MWQSVKCLLSLLLTHEFVAPRLEFLQSYCTIALSCLILKWVLKADRAKVVTFSHMFELSENKLSLLMPICIWALIFFEARTADLLNKGGEGLSLDSIIKTDPASLDSSSTFLPSADYGDVLNERFNSLNTVYHIVIYQLWGFFQAVIASHIIVNCMPNRTGLLWVEDGTHTLADL